MARSARDSFVPHASIPGEVSITESFTQEICRLMDGSGSGIDRVAERHLQCRRTSNLAGMPHSFAITYDYLCPFARIANETIVEAMSDGASLDVSFVPFSLMESHAKEGDPAQWDLPIDELGKGVLALLWSISIRDHIRESFLDFHVALFAARHDGGSDINDPDVLDSVARAAGVDPDEVRTIVASGVPSKILAKEHMNAVENHGVFGVPTFIYGDDAVFVRFMERHNRSDLDRVIDMLSWTNLNEFKRTSIDR